MRALIQVYFIIEKKNQKLAELNAGVKEAESLVC